MPPTNGRNNSPVRSSMTRTEGSTGSRKSH
jgi:hypothetical protein